MAPEGAAEQAAREGRRRQSLLHELAKLDAAQLGALADEFGPALDRMARDWRVLARPGQLPPPGEWRLWLLLAGRGYGKTRAGAQWVDAMARAHPGARIALVGASHHDVRAVMVEGDAGLLNALGPGPRPLWNPALRRIAWPGGAMATCYSAAEPEALRGPAHDFAWADEVARWAVDGRAGEAAWDNLMLGLRLGQRPRVLATTTPRALPLVKRLIAEPGAVVTGGGTADNAANLPPAFIAAMTAQYGGTRLGRQELDGVLVDDVPGALWTRAMLEACRVDAGTIEAGGVQRIVIGVDPPASAAGDACGIIVVGQMADGRGAVLADRSVERASPERWAAAVADAAAHWRADRVVAEANQGGAMVESVLRAAETALPLTLVHASRGKVARAEPVAALYERGRVVHAGSFARLEDELAGLVAGGAYAGPGRSPDRADALVWALTALMLGQRGGGPGVRTLG